MSVRWVLVGSAALLVAATACSSGTESEPPPVSPQASPAPSSSAAAPDPAATAPQGRWRVTVASGSPYYPGGSSEQELTLRIVCDQECIGTIETDSGVIRTVRWDGQRLDVSLPGHESGPARCFDVDGAPVPGRSTMTVDRSGHLVLEGSDPDADGRPTHLAGSYDEEITVDEQSDGCGFPDTFTGSWSWDLVSLESSSGQGAA